MLSSNHLNPHAARLPAESVRTFSVRHPRLGIMAVAATRKQPVDL